MEINKWKLKQIYIFVLVVVSFVNENILTCVWWLFLFFSASGFGGEDGAVNALEINNKMAARIARPHDQLSPCSVRRFFIGQFTNILR